MTDLIELCKGHHEPQEEKAFYEVLKVLKNGATMVEMGSFWSYYSMWFNHQIENAKNFMFDVSEHFLDVGKKNFELNNMKGKFSIDSVQDFNFEFFFETYDVKFIDLLHFDVQGWEFLMLQKTENFLDKIGFMFISTHTDQFNAGNLWGSPKELIHDECLKLIKKYNFKILCEHNMNESASNDGLIVAMNPNLNINIENIEISKLEK
jgi:hypothetical protein